MSKLRAIHIILVATFLFIVSGSLPASASVLLEDLENALMCKCDDKCGKVLINCTCATADKTRADFAKQLESGLTVQQIIKLQVDKYGETVLSAPTKKGFNLTAWITPFAAILGGGFGLRHFAKAWLRKKNSKSHPDKEDKEGQDPAQNKYSNQLQKELDRIDL